MSQTLYASFVDAGHAERAAGALLDHGVRSQDISFIANESFVDADRQVVAAPDATVIYNDPTDVKSVKEINEAEHAAKAGISTTTSADVVSGAAKGVGVGAGVGVLAAAAMLFVPGFGWVLGGGALATALIAAAATTAAGAAAGGVYGYLRDQGLPEDAVTHYTDTVMQGGAVIAVQCPSGEVDQATIQTLLAKYEATNINHFGTMPSEGEAA